MEFLSEYGMFLAKAITLVVAVLIMVILANALNLLGVDSYWQRVAIGVVIIAAAAVDQLRRKRS